MHIWMGGTQMLAAPSFWCLFIVNRICRGILNCFCKLHRGHVYKLSRILYQNIDDKPKHFVIGQLFFFLVNRSPQECTFLDRIFHCGWPRMHAPDFCGMFLTTTKALFFGTQLLLCRRRHHVANFFTYHK